MASTRVSHPKAPKTVLARLKRTYGSPAKQRVDVEIIEQIVLAILARNESVSKAESTLERLKGYYVDFNELRVARAGELAGQLGTIFDEALAKAKQMISVLQDIFTKENSFNLGFVTSKSKQDLEEYFNEIHGFDNYLLSTVILCCCGRQAFPMDDRMLEACKDLELAQGPASLENMQAYLERQLRSADSYVFCMLLKEHSLKDALRNKVKKDAEEKAASEKKAVTKKKKVPTRKKAVTKAKKATSKTKKVVSEKKVKSVAKKKTTKKKDTKQTKSQSKSKK